MSHLVVVRVGSQKYRKDGSGKRVRKLSVHRITVTILLRSLPERKDEIVNGNGSSSKEDFLLRT